MNPKVLIVCDVVGWAWDIKSNYLKYHLQKYYDIDIVHVCFNSPKIDKNKYDLYLSYGFAFNSFIKTKQNINKCITGVTAHRKKIQILASMNEMKHHHANSVLLYNELKNMGKNPFYVPNGVDEKLFYPIISPFYKRSYLKVGHVGKKSINKNQSNFIEPIFENVGAIYNPHYNDYSNKIPHNQMIHKYQKFDVFIAASSEDGTPNGMLEAAACGRPIIINKIGNAPEFIKDGYNGFLVNMNQNEYIEKIRWCQNNPTQVIKMGENARKEILKGWTWKHMSKNYLYMFDTILDIKRDMGLYENPAFHHITK